MDFCGKMVSPVELDQLCPLVPQMCAVVLQLVAMVVRRVELVEVGGKKWRPYWEMVVAILGGAF